MTSTPRALRCALAGLALVAAPLSAQNGPPSVSVIEAPAEPFAMPLYEAENPGDPATAGPWL